MTTIFRFTVFVNCSARTFESGEVSFLGKSVAIPQNPFSRSSKGVMDCHKGVTVWSEAAKRYNPFHKDVDYWELTGSVIALDECPDSAYRAAMNAGKRLLRMLARDGAQADSFDVVPFSLDESEPAYKRLSEALRDGLGTSFAEYQAEPERMAS